MTLIIAGHSLQDSSYGTTQSNYCDGVFFASDSNIVQQGSVLVNGFRKLVEAPIRVASTHFLDGRFHKYDGYDYEGGCVIAFAGSTLVAQHILDSIKNHLSDLRPTHIAGSYQLAMPCEAKKLLSGNYDEDMFQRRDVGSNYLLNSGLIATVVEHSVQSVLDRAKQHKNMQNMFAAYQAEFILSVCCPDTNKYHIYRYEILPAPVVGAVVSMEEIPEGTVAVIGMRTLHEQAANTTFQAAVQAGVSTADVMFEFLNVAIRSQNSIGVVEIGFPSFMYKHEGIRLETKKRQES